MKLAVLAFTLRGCATAKKVAALLPEEDLRLFTLSRFNQEGFAPYTPPLSAFTAPLFTWADALIFIGSTGMAVRAIAPHVRSKKTDPAVLVIEEGGQYVISLLSGHIGGANALARTLSHSLGGTAIVTTATDVNGRFAVDEWAARRGLTISDLGAAKAVSAAILEGDVPFLSDFPTPTPLPPGLIPGESGPVGVYLGIHPRKPFQTTLTLIPKILRLGIGCRRGTPSAAIAAAVDQTLTAHDLLPQAIGRVATIDLKATEPGLLAFCRERGLILTCHSASELSAVPGDFTPSAFVAQVTGVDNVCERAAALSGGRLLISKTALSGVTVAVAEEPWGGTF